MRYLLLYLLTALAAHAASAINGELFVAAGTTGTNAIPTSRTTNVTINATSKVTDAAGVTAFTFRTSNTLSDGDLLAITNNTSRLSYLDSTGRWFARSFYAEDADGSDNFSRIQPGDLRINSGPNTNRFDVDASAGTLQLQLGSTNLVRVRSDGSVLLRDADAFISNEWYPFYAGSIVTNGGPRLGSVGVRIVDSVSEDSLAYWSFNQNIDSANHAAVRLDMVAQAFDGGAYPYFQWTFVVGNENESEAVRFFNGASKVYSMTTNGVTSMHSLVLAGTTNQVTFGATNTAPSGSTSVIAKWVSVQVAGESTVYRIPLYQ